MRRLLLLGMLAMLAGCQAENEGVEDQAAAISPIVARVNGTAIRESDIDAAMTELPDALYKFRRDPQARGQVLRSLIRNEAISQKAHELGLELDPAIRKRIEDARRQILIEAAKEWQLANMATLNPVNIETYYHQHVSDFTLPEQVHARHILLANKKEALAVIDKLRKGEADFASLAASESMDDSNSARGGDLNWFPRGVMVPAFDEAVFSMHVGDISKPIQTRFGWHVIELLGRRPAIQKPLEEVRGEIIGILRQHHLEQWYQKIEKEAQIEVIRPEYRAAK